MSEELRRLVASLSPSKRAMLARLLDAPSEPIAIVGAGCRFPGAATLDEFWQVLLEKRCTTSLPPADHDLDLDAYYAAEPGIPGTLYTKHAGYVRDVDRFDANFFGISAREAESMDPQQRLLLEVTWEALEHAGIIPEDVRGPQTGVFVGICSDDYITRQIRSGRTDAIDVYSLPGVIPSVASGRISYALDFQGPNLSIDTACSSSLVAVHYACQSLRAKECKVALAGGVNLILAPENTVYFSTAGLLSRDGHCKAFDAKGDGFVRAEGCAVVVLKRLADAQADGDAVLAVIRGTSVNHNGHGNGLTAPSVTAQAKVIGGALADANVRAGDVGFVEAHGTGTPMGDAIEIDAIKEAYGEGRGDRRCYVGSVKTNLGHMEGAAGLGGLIKVALSLQNGVIPANLHFTRPNPHIALEGTPFAFPQEAVAWSSGTRARFAGVSSFGFGGTNAHAIVTEAPSTAARAAVKDEAHLLVLSAKTHTALARLAAAYAGAVTQDALRDFCHTASARRTHHAYRLAVRGRTAAEIRSGLESFVRGASSPYATVGGEVTDRPRMGLVVDRESGRWLEALGLVGEVVVDEDTVTTLDRARDPVDAFVVAVDGPGVLQALQRAYPGVPVVRAFGADRTAALAELYVLGCTIAWKNLYPGAACVRLPTYPFERKRHWIQRTIASASADDAARSRHPLLATRRRDLGRTTWETPVSAASLPFVRDHLVGGAAVVPATVFLELAFSAAREEMGGTVCGLDDVVLRQAMILNNDGERRLRLAIADSGEGPCRFTIASAGGTGPEVVHVTGVIAQGEGASSPADPRSFTAASTRPLDSIYETFAAQSIVYGPSFRRLRDVRRGGVDFDAALRGAEPDGFFAHPSALDAALQLFGVALMDTDPARAAGGPYVPVAIRRVRLFGALDADCRVHARLRDALVGDVTVADGEGRRLLELHGVVARRLGGDSLESREGVATGAPLATSAGLDWLREHVARALRVDAQSIDPTLSLNALGFDSLLAVELKNRIDREYGVAIPVVSFLRGLTIAEIADRLAGPPEASAPLSARAGGAAQPVDVAKLSNGEVQSLLARMLEASDDADDRGQS